MQGDERTTLPTVRTKPTNSNRDSAFLGCNNASTVTSWYDDTIHFTALVSAQKTTPRRAVVQLFVLVLLQCNELNECFTWHNYLLAPFGWQ